MVFGLIGALGYAAGAEAQVTLQEIRIQDRTPGRTGDTNYTYNQVGSTNSYNVVVPDTVTAVQLRVWSSDQTHGTYQRKGTSGNFGPGRDQDHTLSTTGPTVLQAQVRQGASTVFAIYQQSVAPAVVVSATTLAVTEGTSPTATYTVTLGAQPAVDVPVRVARGAPYYVLNKVSGTQGVNQDLTFTTGNWNTGQAITVIALDDDNALAGTSNITHTTVFGSTNLSLTVTDDDAALVVSRGSGALALTEGNATTYTVTLKGSPTGTVVVGVTSDDAEAVSAAPGTLTYSATTWNTGQTVTVAAVEDPDENAETATVTHAVDDGASANEFDPAPDVTFTVTVTDNEGLVVNATDLTTNGVDEGMTATYTLALTALPTGSVTVSDDTNTAGNDLDKVSAVPGTLTFTAGNWDTAQTVTVAGREDVDGDNETVSLAHAATSGDTDYAGATIAAVGVTVADNDAPGFLVSPTGLTIAEGESGTYTLRLNTEPGGPVTVAVVAPTNTDVTGAPGSLTFAVGVWNTARTVTVSVGSDADGLNESATVSHTATSSDSNYTIATARPAENVTVMGTDANPPGLAVTPTTLMLTEQEASAGSGTYTVALAAQPSGLVTHTATSGDPTAVTVDEDGEETYTAVLTSQPLAPVVVRIGSDNPEVDTQPGLLQYTVSNWNTAQTVTVRADADADAQGDTATLTHTAAGGDYTGLAGVDLAVSVTDADAVSGAVGVVLSRQALTVAIGGTHTYTVGLTAQPAGTVTVTVFPAAGGATQMTVGGRWRVQSAGRWCSRRGIGRRRRR